jgi:hypothetical protein
LRLSVGCEATHFSAQGRLVCSGRFSAMVPLLRNCIAQGPRVDSGSRRRRGGTPHLQRSLRSVLSRSPLLHHPRARQGAPDRKIARGKSPCGLGCALRNAPEKRVYSQPCQSMEAALHRPSAAPRRAIESAIGGWDAHCAPTKTPEPEYLASKNVPVVRHPTRASSVEIRGRVHRSSPRERKLQ